MQRVRIRNREKLSGATAAERDLLKARLCDFVDNRATINGLTTKILRNGVRVHHRLNINGLPWLLLTTAGPSDLQDPAFRPGCVSRGARFIRAYG